MKKFINNVDDVEKEMIGGLLKAYPDELTEPECGSVIVRKKKKQEIEGDEKTKSRKSRKKRSDDRKN